MTTNEPSTSTAVAEHEAGRLDRAEAIYRARLGQYPDDLPTLIGLADVLTDSGQMAEAEELYIKAIKLSPDSPDVAGAYDGLAAIRQDIGDLEGAIVASKKAAILRGSADDSFGVANTLEYLGRLGDAIEMYVLATEQRQGFSQAHMKAAQYLLQSGKFAEAIPHYLQAIEAHPEIAELHCNLANARRRAGDITQALESVRRALELKPGLPEAHNIMGTIWQERRRPSNALDSFKKALEIKPDYADALNNMGSVYEQAGQIEKAGPMYTRAVELEPRVMDFHENLASNLLVRGQFEQGWKEYDWRRLKATNPGSRPFPQPTWDGGPIAGKTIVLFGEQGFGDTIQFLRYATIVANLGATVIIECRPELLTIARQTPGVSSAFVKGTDWPACDCQAALMSLPMILKTELHSIPNAVPYLKIDPEKSVAFKSKLADLTGKRIGLAWAGSPTHGNDKNRSCPANRLEPLAVIPGLSLVSLQKNRPSTLRQPEPPVSLKLLDLTADLNDFGDTAALIDNLDLVISVDTAVAHLAGAIGKPVWIILPAVNDWRWLRDRDDSPWYPSARLFRQETPGDWSGVIKRVCNALETAG